MQPEPTTHETGEMPESDSAPERTSAQGERVAALRRATALRSATSRAFDTRTERWQEVGLSDQIDAKESRKAWREAGLLLVLLIAVLYGFAHRHDIAFITANGLLAASRWVTAFLLVLIGWGLARTIAKGLAPALMRRMEPGDRRQRRLPVPALRRSSPSSSARSRSPASTRRRSPSAARSPRSSSASPRSRPWAT